MKANEIMTSAKRTFSKVGFGLQKKSPEILVGVGIVGAVASAVLACKATTKAGAIVEESKNSLADIRKANENGITKAGESYSAEDRRKDLAIAYVQTGVKFAKLYAPAVMLGAVSIASILASHNIMKKRNVALAAAYAAVDKSFKDYRDRVIERFGEQVEKELRYNIKAQEIEETVTDDKGKEKKVKQNVNVAGENWDGSDYGPYAKVFDDTHSDWKQDSEMNLFYLRARQAQANDMLKSQGHLFVNEVYDMLGFKRTKAGAVVGWIYDDKKPYGDNFVDFGMTEIRRHDADSDEYKRAFILDFNVVGDITSKIVDHQNDYLAGRLVAHQHSDLGSGLAEFLDAGGLVAHQAQLVLDQRVVHFMYGCHNRSLLLLKSEFVICSPRDASCVRVRPADGADRRRRAPAGCRFCPHE